MKLICTSMLSYIISENFTMKTNLPWGEYPISLQITEASLLSHELAHTVFHLPLMHSSTFPCLDIAPRAFTTRTDPCLQGPNYQQINNPVVIQVRKFEGKNCMGVFCNTPWLLTWSQCQVSTHNRIEWNRIE